LGVGLYDPELAKSLGLPEIKNEMTRPELAQAISKALDLANLS
jgi:hypothetical protein